MFKIIHTNFSPIYLSDCWNITHHGLPGYGVTFSLYHFSIKTQQERKTLSDKWTKSISETIVYNMLGWMLRYAWLESAKMKRWKTNQLWRKVTNILFQCCLFFYHTKNDVIWMWKLFTLFFIVWKLQMYCDGFVYFLLRLGLPDAGFGNSDRRNILKCLYSTVFSV